MPHLPYSPDLAPSIFCFCLFVSLKEKSSQRELFSNGEEVKQKTVKALKGIKINELKNCFEQWGKKPLDRCMASNGGYFEGN